MDYNLNIRFETIKILEENLKIYWTQVLAIIFLWHLKDKQQKNLTIKINKWNHVAKNLLHSKISRQSIER